MWLIVARVLRSASRESWSCRSRQCYALVHWRIPSLRCHISQTDQLEPPSSYELPQISSSESLILSWANQHQSIHFILLVSLFVRHGVRCPGALCRLKRGKLLFTAHSLPWHGP
ncbi:hypothetical protein BJX68DRAFT_187549 [Aspergillus pseudodeflectus]|uniref:Uncharacterized protein n=1 Tax=Aspergillus pseudodeflectus TaxID=176178 RepID=A0ABR4JJZ8_9EURO